LAITVLLSPLLANVGCQHIGPPTIAGDRLAYNKAIASSWKQQMLLNIVRLRYKDMVDFVDVGQASQSYTVTGTAEASFGASIYPLDKMMNTLTPTLTGTRTKTDNPTVIYTPQSGSDFTRNLIAPIKPNELFNLIEERYSNVMGLAVISINGIHNDPKDTKFKRVAKAISDAYFNGDVSFPIETQPDSKDKRVFMTIPEQDSKPCQICAVSTIRELLRLKAAVTKFEIVVGTHPAKETEIAVRTHSAISAMIWLSHYVPERIGSARTDPEPPLKVYRDSRKPGDEYDAIKYRGNWYWIDWNNDDRSSQAMIYLRTLLALADTAARPTAPVLTIPASR
jgi:hypothetical protein